MIQKQLIFSQFNKILKLLMYYLMIKIKIVENNL